MTKFNTSFLVSAPLAAVLLTVPSSSVSAADVAVNCDVGEKIGPAVDRAAPGDRVVVSGLCKESVFVKPHKALITLDGQGKATIEGPPPATVAGNRPDAFTVFVMGQRIKIEGFTITGGFNAIHLSGPANAEIANNIIRGTGAGGIHMDKGSTALIYGNTIENNKLFGINVMENSFARIGFRFPTLPQFQPNVIRNNDGDGIILRRGSIGWTLGNEIANNSGSGVVVDSVSQAEIAANDISGNLKDGISVTLNSGVSFRSVDNSRPETGNKSSTPNAGFGVSCDVGGYVEGEVGSLSGRKGAHVANGNCLERIR